MMATARVPGEKLNTNVNGQQEQSILFNPSEHSDLAHFFAHVDQAETFALTANEWLGIRSNGQQFNPVGSVGPNPNSRPNNALTSATRSLMALNTPVMPPPTPVNTQSNGQIPSPVTNSAVSVRAWRPHETPFDPVIHGSEQELTRRPSTSSSQHRKQPREHSIDSAARKRPAPPAHADSLPSKRARSVSHSQAIGGNGISTVLANSNSAPLLPLSSPGQPSKPPLLTAEQKKANHIISEQKRRAKIRRGYDALCEVVPSLRSAILAEQEANANLSPQDSKKKKGKTPTKAMDSNEIRAGPKSESVVLSQTIDYMEILMAQKEELLNRLRNSQSVLPGIYDSEPGIQPWEREWDGGTGVEEGEDDEEDSDEEDTA